MNNHRGGANWHHAFIGVGYCADGGVLVVAGGLVKISDRWDRLSGLRKWNSGA